MFVVEVRNSPEAANDDAYLPCAAEIDQQALKGLYLYLRVLVQNLAYDFNALVRGEQGLLARVL